MLEQHHVRLITTLDGQDRSKDDIYTTIMNALAASQSRQEQIDKADRVLVGKRKTASQGEYIGGRRTSGPQSPAVQAEEDAAQ